MALRPAVLAVALLTPSVVVAQDLRADGGPYAPIVLLLPSGPRTLAVGNTGVAGRDDDVIFFNPAQLVIARGFSGSVERYSATASGGALSAVTRFNTGGIGIGMRMVDYQAQPNLYPTDRGTMLEPTVGNGTSLEMAVGVGQVIKGIRVGVAGKYVEDNVPAVRASRGAVDLGLSKDFFGPYTFALAVQNLGSSITIPCAVARVPAAGEFDCVPPPGLPPFPTQFTSVRLPLRTTLGVQTQRPVGQFDLMATAAVSALRMGWLGASGGAELGYSWLDGYNIALRAGARSTLPGEAAFTAGAGFTMDRLSIDYAAEALTGSHWGQRIGLRVR
jgi:hypothetical protein